MQSRDGICFIRITPEAGSVKTGEFRYVPLHRQVIDEGFLTFVEAARPGPLFFKTDPLRKSATHPSKAVAGRISQWLQASALVPDTVQPNHAWRHRFKTVGREAGIDGRILDAIQGHAARTAGDDYGEVTLRAKSDAIARLPVI